MAGDDTDRKDDAEAVVDWNAARSLTGGDDALLDELIELFPEESAKHLAAIRAAIEEGDAPALTRAAHTLKSSARLFGAKGLAARALELEELGRCSKPADALARLPELESETERVLAALKRGYPAA